MKLLTILFMMNQFAQVAFADGNICVETIKGTLCANTNSIQDSSMKHQAYEVSEFTLNGSKIVLSKDFSARFLCHAFRPGAINPRPQLPFGLSKTTKKVVTRWTMYTNGDCRPTFGDALVGVDCDED